MTTAPAAPTDLDPRFAALWIDQRQQSWRAIERNEVQRQLPLLRDLAQRAPSTFWGRPSPAKVQALIDGLVTHGIWLDDEQVLMHGRLPMPGLASFGRYVTMAADTLVLNQRHYDLSPEQVGQVRQLAHDLADRRAMHMDQPPSDAQAQALRETLLLQDEMAKRPKPVRAQDDRQDSGGWNAMGTSYIGGSGNPYDSWSP